MYLQEVAMNSFKASEDKKVNDNVRIYNNPQKSQPEVKRRPNLAITENLIRSQNIKTVPGNRMYASMTKYGKVICIIVDSHIKRFARNIFHNSIKNGNAYLNSLLIRQKGQISKRVFQENKARQIF